MVKINETFIYFSALWDKILEKLRKHGTIAKRRLLRFVDICLGDTLLLPALELGDWKTALLRFEAAIVKSDIADKKTCEQLRKGIKILVSLCISFISPLRSS